MSGNPFRKQPPQRLSADALQSAQFETAEDLSTQDTERRSSKSKRVRIATPPPLSPDLPDENPIIRRVSYELHEGSPPPSPRSFEEAFPAIHDPSADDPFGRSADETALGLTPEAIDNTRRNSKTASIVPRNASGGIVNPFQRTMTPMDPAADPEDAKDNSGGDGAEDSKPDKPRMDVDAFKRMLMNGSTDPDSSEESSTGTRGQTRSTFENYSIHGPSATPSQPRASEADLGSPGDSPTKVRPTYNADGSSSSEKKTKPPPPKQRRSKVADQPRIPQTVSFSDFAPTETPELESRTPGKSLPPIPVGKTPAETALTPISSSLADQAVRQRVESSGSTTPEVAAAEPQTLDTPQRKPPPPPLARRSSQPKTQQQPESETSQLSGLSQKPQAPSSISSSSIVPEQSSASKPAKPPPPPPTRRPGPKQAPEAADLARSEVVRTSITDEVPNSTSSRSSSLASRNRSSLPPPPPPRRRRDSSKSSIDQPSQTTIASLVSPSNHVPPSRGIEETPPELAPPTHTTAAEGSLPTVSRSQEAESNVLADMDRLQAEVDALKRKYGRNA